MSTFTRKVAGGAVLRVGVVHQSMYNHLIYVPLIIIPRAPSQNLRCEV